MEWGMKTSELIEVLKKSLEEDGDRKIILSGDSEGNKYSPLSSYWTGAYIPETEYSGEAYLDSLTEADKESGYTQEDVRTDGILAIFFGPLG
jgi:hypothetical protein